MMLCMDAIQYVFTSDSGSPLNVYDLLVYFVGGAPPDEAFEWHTLALLTAPLVVRRWCNVGCRPSQHECVDAVGLGEQA